MKTVTVCLDDDTYRLIQQAARGQSRSISNFIEYATLSYLTDAASVSDQEMAEILSDPDLVSTLQHARSEVNGKKYRGVEAVSRSSAVRLGSACEPENRPIGQIGPISAASREKNRSLQGCSARG